MSINVGVGLAEVEDSYIVGVNAAQQAVSVIGTEPSVIIVCASSQYDQEQVNAGVRSVSGNALLIGSTTAGEITTAGPAKRHSVAVMAILSDRIHFFGGVGENIASNAFEAGKHAAEEVKAKAKDTLKAFMMFP